MSRQTVVGVFAVLLAAASVACGSNGGEQGATVAPTVTAIETPAAAPETFYTRRCGNGHQQGPEWERRVQI